MCPRTPASRVCNPPTPGDEPLPCSSKKKKGPDGPHVRGILASLVRSLAIASAKAQVSASLSSRCFANNSQVAAISSKAAQCCVFVYRFASRRHSSARFTQSATVRMKAPSRSIISANRPKPVR